MVTWGDSSWSASSQPLPFGIILLPAPTQNPLMTCPSFLCPRVSHQSSSFHSMSPLLTSLLWCHQLNAMAPHLSSCGLLPIFLSAQGKCVSVWRPTADRQEHAIITSIVTGDLVLHAQSPGSAAKYYISQGSMSHSFLVPCSTKKISYWTTMITYGYLLLFY